jgi:hypothetical protein
MKTVHFPPLSAKPGEWRDGAPAAPLDDPLLFDRLETYFKLGEELEHCREIYKSIGPRGDVTTAAIILARAARRFAVTAVNFAAFDDEKE